MNEIDLEATLHRLAANAEIIRTCIEPVSEQQACWKTDPQTWSLREVLVHMLHEERFDFRMHLQEIFNDPPLPWQRVPMQNPDEALTSQNVLDEFLVQRQASIQWLQALAEPNWQRAAHLTLDNGEVYTLRAGDVLVSWLAHDFLHIRQMNECLYAWNEHQAKPYSVDYAGGW